jgi:hypothetical protein
MSLGDTKLIKCLFREFHSKVAQFGQTFVRQMATVLNRCKYLNCTRKRTRRMNGWRLLQTNKFVHFFAEAFVAINTFINVFVKAFVSTNVFVLGFSSAFLGTNIFVHVFSWTFVAINIFVHVFTNAFVATSIFMHIFGSTIVGKNILVHVFLEESVYAYICTCFYPSNRSPIVFVLVFQHLSAQIYLCVLLLKHLWL